jgi:tetratricopeptide (TPR) repeat protein
MLNRPDWPWGAALVLLVAIVYWPTLGNGFIWDDDWYVENNGTLRTWQGLADIWFKLGAVPQYYPLVHSTFWVEYHLWGLDPRGYHVVNMLLHATAVVVLWRLLARLAVPGAWLAAAIFAVHPLQVESVAWVSERKNVLSCALAVGSLLAYLRFSPPESRLPTASGDAQPLKWSSYFVALGLFLAALLSKTVTCSVPAVLLVLYWWKQGRLTRRGVALLVPFFVVGVALAFVTAWMEKVHVGAEGKDWILSPVERVLLAGRALWFYAGKLAWPHPLVFFYQRWTIDGHVWWQFLFPLAAASVIIGLWVARKRIGRGPLAGVVIFAGVLVPALGFFDVFPFRYSFVADHFQYHASIGLIAVAVSAATILMASRPGQMPWPKRLGAAGVLLVLAVVAHRQTYVYKNVLSLCNNIIAYNPNCWAAYSISGTYLLQQAKYDEAVVRLRDAVRLAPDRATLHTDLGAALILTERFDEAVVEERRALALEPQNASTLYNYSAALRGAGDLTAATESLRAALKIAPQLDIAQYALGDILVAQGMTEEAVGSLEEAVRLQPANAKYREDLAATLIRLGRLAPAKTHLRVALQLNPRSAEACYLSGTIDQARGDVRSAVSYFEAALALNPRHTGAAASLKRASQASGSTSKSRPAESRDKE